MIESIKYNLPLIIVCVAVATLMITIILYSNLILNPERQMEKEMINVLDCKQLKQHILDDDMTYFTVGYLEHRYTWRCEK